MFQKVKQGSICTGGRTVHIDVRGRHREGPSHQCCVSPLNQVVRADSARVRSRLQKGPKSIIQPRKHYNYSIDPYYSFEIMSHCGWIASLSNQGYAGWTLCLVLEYSAFFT